MVERERIPLSAMRKLENALKDPASGLKIAAVDAEVAVFKQAQEIEKLAKQLKNRANT